MPVNFIARRERVSICSRSGGAIHALIKAEDRRPRLAFGVALAAALIAATASHARAGEDCSAEPDLAASGRTVAEQACALCHGLEGRGDPENRQMTRLTTPDLAGQSAQYLAGALKGYAKGFMWQEDPDSVFFTEGMRIDDYMGQVAVRLDSNAMQAVAFWYHCQE